MGTIHCRQFFLLKPHIALQIWVATTGDVHNLYTYSNRLQPAGPWRPSDAASALTPQQKQLAARHAADPVLVFEPRSAQPPDVLWLGTYRLPER